MEQLEQQMLHISHSSEVKMADRAAKTMALTLGFNEKESEEIALVTRELASNLIKHAKKGTLTLTPLNENNNAGIQIESADNGPGIADVEHEIKDGFSTTGSLGYGLGTVNRLMDRFDITSHCGKESGTHIVCKRWLRKTTRSEMPCPLDVGAATRSHPGMTMNGDAFVIKKWDQSILAGIIDGLGHGQFAHRASQKARLYIESHYDQLLEEIFRGVERSCHATRGVVMAIARFDWDLGKLTFASLGNIEARVFGSPEPMNFSIRRGILGVKMIKPVITEHRWEPHYIMTLYSDGIKSHWRWEDFPDLLNESSNTIAKRLLGTLARDSDDATVIVVKKASV